MPFHDELAFADLHKAKINAGNLADRPAFPEGIGDIYWAYDTQDIYIANAVGADWVLFEGGGGAGIINIGDLQDVNTVGADTGYVLMYNGSTSRWEAQLVDFVTELNGLSDVNSGLVVSKGRIFVYNGSKWDSLPIGDNGLYLRLNSGTSTGLEWAEVQIPISFNAILTDDAGSILIDDAGNVTWIE